MSHHLEPSEAYRQLLRFERLRASLMSLICSLLFLFALAAATRIPDYLATPDYFRLIGAISFFLLALAGLVVNIYHHHCLWRLASAQKGD